MKKLLLIITTFLISMAKAYPQINVAFAIDNKYPIFTMIMMNSILDNNISNEKYTFYIIENDLSNHNKDKMSKFIKKKNQSIEFIHFDTKIIDLGKNLFGFSNRISPIAIARIYIPNLLPQDVEKVLYLDGDMLSTTDIKPLYDTDLDKYYAGMVRNIVFIPYDHPAFKPGKYYNSGLILINVKLWKKDKITEKLVSYLQNNINSFIYNEDNKRFLYPDQDLINIVLKDRILKLDDRWNNQCFENGLLSPYDNEGIYHYVSKIKPWNFPHNMTPPQKAYLKYWANCELSIYRYYYILIALKNFILTRLLS